MKKRTLRTQFNFRLFIILISITLLSGIFQFYYIKNQIADKVEQEAAMITKAISQGIKETDIASRAIEKQIDFKIEAISKRISDQLPKKLNEITAEELVVLRNQMNLAGIDIFAKENDIISVVKSSEPDEVGFSLKDISEEGYKGHEILLNGGTPEANDGASYINDNIVVLYTAQAGSREEPLFFKYAYYHEPGTDYFISPFIEANEVYQFTQEVGPISWIEQVLEENQFAIEIAVLDPRVFADPSLAELMYPPLEKVVYGTYSYKTDEQILVNMVDNPQEVTIVEEHNGDAVYKLFIPYDDGRVIYVALDYEKVGAPYANYSLILIGFGFISLLILYLMTTQFFKKIYRNISKIIEQIRFLEKGDFTARSNVNDRGELEQLSQSTNTMAETLNDILGQTKEQAERTERHAYILESEANNSVEKVYTMSMEATTESREKTEEIFYLFDEIEKHLDVHNPEDMEFKKQLTKVRQLVQIQSNSTTEMTITLSDLLKSLHEQSSSLSEISKKLLKSLDKFELGDTNNK